MIRHSTETSEKVIRDMASGFSQFIDEVLRGRENKTILNSSVGLASLKIGIPGNIKSLGDLIEKWDELQPVQMLANNKDVNLSATANWQHPLFSTNPENFTLFGLDFTDFWRQLTEAGYVSTHTEPYYNMNLAEKMGLPDLPYGEIAHLAHMGMALYDTGRTFQDLWNEPTLKHNIFKIMTHPEMGHTLAHRGVMLTVMGLLHPLGPVIAIGVAYLCAHLVHSAFGLLERNKDAVREIENVPVLRHIYNATGIKEWAEMKEKTVEDTGSIADIELEKAPEIPANNIQHTRYERIIDLHKTLSTTVHAQ